MKKRISVVEGDVSNVKENVSAVKERISVVEGDVSNVKEDAGAVKERISVVEGDVSNVKKDAGAVKERISVVEGDVSNVKEDAGAVKKRISVVEGDVSNVKEDACDVKERVYVVAADVSNIKEYVSDVKGQMAVVKGDVSNMKEAVCDVKEQVGKLSKMPEYITAGLPPRPSPSPYFVGRTKELHEIRNVLEARGSAAITGFGGLGKTEMMAAFVDRAETNGDAPGGIFWIATDGGDAPTVIESLAKYTEKLVGRKLQQEDRCKTNIVVGILQA